MRHLQSGRAALTRPVGEPSTVLVIQASQVAIQGLPIYHFRFCRVWGLDGAEQFRLAYPLASLVASNRDPARLRTRSPRAASQIRACFITKDVFGTLS